jgi:hypothetical protein
MNLSITKIRMKSKQVLAMVCALAGATQVFAQTTSTTTITFDNIPVTGTDLGYYNGVTFGADEQVTGQVLPEFPAHSAPNILINANLFNPTISFSFSEPVTQFSFWYASADGFTGVALDSHGHQVGTFTGNVNTSTPGPATLMQTGVTTGIPDIASVVITDSGGLGTLIGIDDLTFTNVPDATSSLALFGVAGLGLLAFRRKVVA